MAQSIPPTGSPQAVRRGVRCTRIAGQPSSGRYASMPRSKSVKELEPGGSRNTESANGVIPTLESAIPTADSASARPPRNFKEDIYEVELKGVNVLVAEMWVPVRKLVVDDAYQRSVNEARARRYAVDWNQALAGLVTVSARKDGTYALLDGQHRP